MNRHHLISAMHILYPFVTIALLLFTCSSCSPQVNDKPDSIARELDPFLTEAFALDLSPGMAVAVVKGQEIVYAKGFGFADVDKQQTVDTETLFYIASTTKSFTALASTLLHYSGKINLDRPVTDYLPSIELQPPLSADELTLRQCLTCTHGIDDDGPVVFRTAYSGVFTNDQLIKLLKNHNPLPQGNAFEYTNVGFNIAGLVMDAELDMSWKEVIKKKVLAPLGMDETSSNISHVETDRLALPYTPNGDGFQQVYYAKKDENMHAAGGHVTTVLDLAKWVEVNMNQGRIGQRQIFPEEVIAETHRVQVKQDKNWSDIHRHAWGLGWDIGTYESDTLIHRFGSFSGFFSHVSFMPEHRIGVIIQTNGGWLSYPLSDMIAFYIYDALLEKPMVKEKYAQRLKVVQEQAIKRLGRLRESMERRADQSQEPLYSLATYTGVYTNKQFGSMEWYVSDDTLNVKLGVMKSIATIQNASENKFRVELKGRGQMMSFVFEGGAPHHLVYEGQEYLYEQHYSDR